MNSALKQDFADLHSPDRMVQNRAFLSILTAVEQPVDWAYEVWDELLAGLSDKDNHVRAISAQLLAGLARSDPDRRILRDFDALMAGTRDDRLVTARHTLLSIWKVGLAGSEQEKLVLDGLSRRYRECITEKNCTLIRYDILEDLKKLYLACGNDEIRRRALDLIDQEDDLKYRARYNTLWMNA